MSKVLKNVLMMSNPWKMNFVSSLARKNVNLVFRSVPLWNAGFLIRGTSCMMPRKNIVPPSVPMVLLKAKRPKVLSIKSVPLLKMLPLAMVGSIGIIWIKNAAWCVLMN